MELHGPLYKIKTMNNFVFTQIYKSKQLLSNTFDYYLIHFYIMKFVSLKVTDAIN